MKLRIVFLYAILLAICGIGCGGGGGGDDTHPTSSVTVPEALKAQTIARYPGINPPNPVTEQPTLDQQDRFLFNVAFPDMTYDFDLRRVRDAVGIDYNSIYLIAIDDFRDHHIQFSSGVTGNDLSLLDSKFIAILYDYATYLASPTTFPRYPSAYAAVDEIVRVQNGAQGDSRPILDRGKIPQAALRAADGIFDSLVGTAMYHEFGHFFRFPDRICG